MGRPAAHQSSGTSSVEGCSICGRYRAPQWCRYLAPPTGTLRTRRLTALVWFWDARNGRRRVDGPTLVTDYQHIKRVFSVAYLSLQGVTADPAPNRR